MASKIGRMRERITFQQSVKTPDGIGGFSTTWQNIASRPTIFAKVQPLNAREQLQAQQIQSPISHKITIRYRKDLNTSMRILWDGQPLNIHGITNPDEKKRYTEIQVEQGVAT